MVSTTLCLFGLLALVHYGESAVTWTTPSGGSGALATSAPEQDVTTDTDLTDLQVTAAAVTGQVIASYTIKTNPGSKFAITGTIVGQLQLAANEGLDYEFQSAFVLAIEAKDNTAVTAESSTATVTVNVANIATDPTFTAPYLCVVIADHTVAGATVTSIPATYTGSGTLAYTVAPTSTFAIDTDGVVTVKTGVTANRATASTHTAIMTVGTGTTTSSTVLNVCVGTATQCGSCGSSGSSGSMESGAAAAAFSLMSLFAALLVLVV